MVSLIFAGCESPTEPKKVDLFRPLEVTGTVLRICPDSSYLLDPSDVHYGDILLLQISIHNPDERTQNVYGAGMTLTKLDSAGAPLVRFLSSNGFRPLPPDSTLAGTKTDTVTAAWGPTGSKWLPAFKVNGASFRGTAFQVGPR
jgi:hypothetical protein